MQAPCDPARLAQARRLHETTTLSYRALGRETTLSPTTIHSRAKREKWSRPPGAHGVPAPLAAAVAAKRAGRPVGRMAILRRIERPLEEEMAASGERLGDPNLAPDERRRALETIAERTRLLGQLGTLRPARRTRAAPPRLTRARPDDDALPRDLDALRNALAERLERLCAARLARRGGGDGEP